MAITVFMNIRVLHERRSWSLPIRHSITLLIYITVLLFIITLSADICESFIHCDDGIQYRNGSKFEINLNSVLNTLVQHASRTRFNTSVYGQSPDQIYGLLQCMGGRTLEQCHNCSVEAKTRIPGNCVNDIGVAIWLDDCFLRYENFSFFGQLDNVTWHFNYTSDGKAGKVSNPEVFYAALSSLFHNLLVEAASGSRYASGTILDALSRKINCEVQCFSDISTNDCKTCLSNTINNILASPAGAQGAKQFAQGAKQFTKNCIVRYLLISIVHPPPPAKSKKIPLILGVVAGSLLLVFVCVFATGRRLKDAIFLRGYEVHGQVEESTLINKDLAIVFKMETLVAATENFHDDNKLGEGGFGPVYKGTMHDGKEIAVKKLSVNSKQGKREFLNEVELVTKIQHRNLVNLLGYCAGGSETLLVYEYLPNKSLDKILFDPNKRKHLDWQKRYVIILGVARGLLYLHQDSQPRIIHRDIKSSNILLDEKLNPKITDFGIAKLFPEDQSHVSTRVAGTYGYMAPEYAMQGQLSAKADVYSFGVLLLELITGRNNTDYSLSHEMQILLGWAWSSYVGGNIVQIIDPSIIETCDEGQALRCIHVGLLCTQADSSLRPPMSTVTLMLSTDSITLPDPTRPIVLSSNTQITSSASGSSHAYATTTSTSALVIPMVAPLSNAEASITDLVPR